MIEMQTFYHIEMKFVYFSPKKINFLQIFDIWKLKINFKIEN